MNKTEFDFFKETLFEDGIFGKEPNKEPNRYPLTDICTSEDGTLYIEVALAGFTKDMLEVELINDEIHIIGKYVNNDVVEYKYYQKNISTKDFVRKIRLANEYANGEFVVDFSDGLLTITVHPSVKNERNLLEIS